MKLILVRGHSGSGKTTFAREVLDCAMSGQSITHFEADMYFNVDGEYAFDPALLKDAHAWCQNSTDMAMEVGFDRIVVSNTFTRLWEMQPYLDMADKYGYDVVVYRATGSYPNVHGVPDDVIERQKGRMERYPGEIYV